MFVTCVRYLKSFADPPDISLWKEEKWHNDLESCLVWICCGSCQFIKINLQEHFSFIFLWLAVMKYLFEAHFYWI